MSVRSEQIHRYADAFAALGAEPRLRIVRLLLSAHPDGLVVNEIGQELDIAASTLSHHLDKLKNEGLVRVQRDYAPDLPPVECVVIELEQVFLNLIKNAAQAMAGHTEREPVLKLCTRAEGSYAVVTVEDRVNYCFTRSLAGSKLPADSREMQDIVAYLAYISKGVPNGEHIHNEGLAKMPALTGDSSRGRALFTDNCWRVS